MAGVKLKGFDKTNKRINDMLRRTQNQTNALSVIKQQGLSDVLKHFKDEQGIQGKWKPSQRAIKQGGKTLQDTGRLRGATIATSGTKKAVISNNVGYGSYHQYGKKIKRDFMWLSDKAISLILKTMARFIMEGK